jgi:hypothetical protein
MRFISLCSLGIEEFRFSQSKLTKGRASINALFLGLDGPKLILLRHAGRIELCPLLRAAQKTFAQAEFFDFDPNATWRALRRSRE